MLVIFILVLATASWHSSPSAACSPAEDGAGGGCPDGQRESSALAAVGVLVKAKDQSYACPRLALRLAEIAAFEFLVPVGWKSSSSTLLSCCTAPDNSLRHRCRFRSPQRGRHSQVPGLPGIAGTACLSLGPLTDLAVKTGKRRDAGRDSMIALAVVGEFAPQMVAFFLTTRKSPPAPPPARLPRPSMMRMGITLPARFAPATCATSWALIVMA
jgi:hypothetical protein